MALFAFGTLVPRFSFAAKREERERSVKVAYCATLTEAFKGRNLLSLPLRGSSFKKKPGTQGNVLALLNFSSCHTCVSLQLFLDVIFYTNLLLYSSDKDDI